MLTGTTGIKFAPCNYYARVRATGAQMGKQEKVATVTAMFLKPLRTWTAEVMKLCECAATRCRGCIDKLAQDLQTMTAVHDCDVLLAIPERFASTSPCISMDEGPLHLLNAVTCSKSAGKASGPDERTR
jgi:hypothetical protein